jgi:hypothetical protein
MVKNDHALYPPFSPRDCCGNNGTLFAGDQKGAERTKQPVAAEILAAPAATAEDPAVGNVEVTYADGTKDLWTTKGNCSLPRVAPDGTVGWTVNGPADIELHDTSTGQLIASVRAYAKNLPEWARPYAD